MCETPFSPAGCQTFRAFTTSIASHVVQFTSDAEGRRVTFFSRFMTVQTIKSFNNATLPTCVMAYRLYSNLSHNKPPTINQNQKIHHSGGNKKQNPTKPGRLFPCSAAEWVRELHRNWLWSLWPLINGMTRCDGPNEHLKESYSEEGAHRSHDFE